MRYLTYGSMALLLAALSGCISNQQKINDSTDAGEVALGGHRYDDAVSDADAALKIRPSARAHYLRGRAEEDRPKPDSFIAASDLNQAKTDYQAALDLHPGQPLEARCHAGLANVAFDQDDYSTALFHWTTALDDLDQPDWRSMALYRIGECQQRLGHYDDADKTFAQVVQEYPDQDVAAKARAREHVRGFYLQLGAYSRPEDAGSAIKAAATLGVQCQEIADQGLLAVRAGPFTTYLEASQTRATVAPKFPDAVIGP